MNRNDDNCLHLIYSILLKYLIKAWVIKRKILKLKAHKTQKSCFIKYVNSIQSTAHVNGQNIFLKRFNDIVYRNRNNSVHIWQPLCLSLYLSSISI